MRHEIPNVVVVVARCSNRAEDFGIRLEEVSVSHWEADWAFALSSRTAKREGFAEQSVIEGRMLVAEAYPGCPHCDARSFSGCGCGRIACWDGDSTIVTCPWCHQTFELDRELTEVRSERDR